MNKLLFLAWGVALSAGCLSGTGRQAPAGKVDPLHFILPGPGPCEPIGLLDLHGVYRLFYSGAPGPGGVGQMVSKDLVHWTRQVPFSFPPKSGKVFKGGIFIDSNNLSGYGTREKPPLVAILSSEPFLAFSVDEGITWTAAHDKTALPKPLLDNPQAISPVWYPATRKWIMGLAVQDHVEFYSSSDLRTWKFESSLGGDFFPEEVKWKRTTLYPCGDSPNWVLLADIRKEGKAPTPGGTVYFIGSFDGHSFENRSAQLHWLDYGEDIYSSIIAVGKNGRCITLGWKEDSVSQPITIPRELHTEEFNDEWIITTTVAPPLKKLAGKETVTGPLSVSYQTGDVPLVSGVKMPMEVFLDFNTVNIQKGSFPVRFGIGFRNDKGERMAFVFDRFGYYYIDRSGLPNLPMNPVGREPAKMPFEHTDSTMRLDLIIDDGIIECFAEGGKLVMSGTYPPGENFNQLVLFR